MKRKQVSILKKEAVPSTFRGRWPQAGGGLLALLLIFLLTIQTTAQTMRWERIKPISDQTELLTPDTADFLLVEDATDGLRKSLKIINLPLSQAAQDSIEALWSVIDGLSTSSHPATTLTSDDTNVMSLNSLTQHLTFNSIPLARKQLATGWDTGINGNLTGFNSTATESPLPGITHFGFFATLSGNDNYGGAFVMRNGRAYFQTREAGILQGWKEFYHTGNFDPNNIDLDFAVTNGALTNMLINAGGGIQTPFIKYAGANYLRATGTASILSTPSTTGTIFLRPQGDAILTNQATYDSNGNLTIAGNATANNLTGINTGDETLASLQSLVINDFHNLGGTDLVDDADNDPTNELQDISGIALNTQAIIDTASQIRANIPTNNNQLINGAGYITGYTVTETDVTQYQGTLSIVESQISDLSHFSNSDETDQVYSADSANIVWFSDLLDNDPFNEWQDTTEIDGLLQFIQNHSIDFYVESDPIFTSDSANIVHFNELDYFTGADITGNESAFEGWDKNEADDFSGDYNDLINKPTILTVNDATITLQRNGVSIGDFTLNQITNETFNFIDENTTYTSSDFDHDQTINFLQSEHFTQAQISITASQVSNFDEEVTNNITVSANTAKVSANNATITLQGTAVSGSPKSFALNQEANETFTLDKAISSEIDHNQTANYDINRHFLQSEILITENQISDLGDYAEKQLAVGWDTGITNNMTGFNSTEVESPISGITHFGILTTLSGNTDYGGAFVMRNGRAFFQTREAGVLQGWNEFWHSGNLNSLSNLSNDLSLSDFSNDVGYITSYTETDPSVNNSIITLQRNGSNIGSFTLNQSGNETFNFIDENTTYTSSDFDHDQTINFLQSEHFTQAEISIGVSQINDFDPNNIDLDFAVTNGALTNTLINAGGGIQTPFIKYAGANYLRATGTASILSTLSTTGTIFLRPQGDAILTNQATYDYNGNLAVANSITVNSNIVWHAGNFTPSAKQNNITLTTTGNSGASTFAGDVLNVPNYTLSGLGGFPLTDLQDGTKDLDINSLLVSGTDVVLSDGTNADYFVYGNTVRASKREDFLSGSVNKKAGFYWSSTTANAPTTTTYGYIHVPLSNGDSYAFELAGRDSRYYLRSLSGGVYGNWGEIWHSGNSNNTSSSWAVAADTYDSSWNDLQEAAPKDGIYDRMENTNYMSSKGFWSGTQAAYDALGSYDSNTIYFIED